MTDCFCCAASYAVDPNLLMETPHWQVILADDQYYLGRCVVVLKRHSPSLSELRPEEWADLKVVIERMESTLHDLFSAEPFNWSCLMNAGYHTDPPAPHVHFHLWPRYSQAVQFGGLTFEDNEFGTHYDHTGRRSVPEQVRAELIKLLQVRLSCIR